MITYQEIKNWIEANKQKLILSLCFVVVFIGGFGAGRYDSSLATDKTKFQSHYTTPPAKKPAVLPSKEGDNPLANQGQQGTVAGVSTTTPTGSCVIKAHVNSKGKKIYHVPGGAYYKIVKPTTCFATEAEAQAAGYIKSSR